MMYGHVGVILGFRVVNRFVDRQKARQRDSHRYFNISRPLTWSVFDSASCLSSLGCPGPLISAVALNKRRSGPFHDRRPILVFLLQCLIALFKAQNIYCRSKTDPLFHQFLLKVALGKGRESRKWS